MNKTLLFAFIAIVLIGAAMYWHTATPRSKWIGTTFTFTEELKGVTNIGSTRANENYDLFIVRENNIQEAWSVRSSVSNDGNIIRTIIDTVSEPPANSGLTLIWYKCRYKEKNTYDGPPESSVVALVNTEEYYNTTSVNIVPTRVWKIDTISGKFQPMVATDFLCTYDEPEPS